MMTCAATFFGLAALLTVSPSSSWLKGYAKTVSGETIGYHSPYPEATSALLVRATDGAMAVEWKTEPLPADKLAVREELAGWGGLLGGGQGNLTHGGML